MKIFKNPFLAKKCVVCYNKISMMLKKTREGMTSFYEDI